MASLSDKLKALGVQIGARNLPPPRPRNPYAIDKVVPGRSVETPYGEAFLVETRYPVDHCQGHTSLRMTASLCVIAKWANDPRLAALAPDALTFLDTETTGLATGTGTYAFMVGAGRYDGETFHLAQFFMRDPAEELALLDALTTFLHPRESPGESPCQAFYTTAPAESTIRRPCGGSCGGPGQALVTFNGKAFDIPLLNARYIATRYVACGDPLPLTSPAHLDLLPLARRLWRDRLPSRALGSLEAHILGAVRSEEDVPGWMIPGMYFDYLRSGDARPLRSVFYHNAMDVLSMAALVSHIAALLDGVLADPLGCPSVHELDLGALGRLFEELGHTETAVQLYRRGLAHSQRTREHLSSVQKRRGQWAEAVALWREAAQDGQIDAYVELAKFYEHRQRDYAEAARWTQAALDRVYAPGYPPFERARWQADLEHRLARLRRKLKR